MKEEKETVYDEAIETAKEIEVVENVMIQTATTQLSFSSLMFGLERGDFVIPDFQRMYHWTEEQAEQLAISLVRGMPIPPIYGYRNAEQQVVILDGQQRVLSLYFYYIGKFLGKKRNAFIDVRKANDGSIKFREYLESCGLKEKKYQMESEGKNGKTQIIDITYQNISDRVKRKIDFSPITLVEINVDSKEYKERTLHKIFANLNIGGTPLSSQELRNGIYGCKFYEMLYDINDNSKKWRILYNNKITEVNKESKDVETLLRMCAFDYYIKGTGNQFELTGYKGKISTLLDSFSERAREFSDNQIEGYRLKLLEFIDSIEKVSGKNKGVALASFFVAWNRLKEKPFITREKYDAIVGSDAYKETNNSGTSARSEIEKRIRCVYEQLSRND